MAEPKQTTRARRKAWDQHEFDEKTPGRTFGGVGDCQAKTHARRPSTIFLWPTLTDILATTQQAHPSSLYAMLAVMTRLSRPA